MLRFLSTLVLVLLGCVQAQFIQRWTWQNLQAPNSDVYVPTPFWHREAIKGLRQVLIPATDIILEYNRNKMPAICQNVRNWEADASKSTWAGRQAGWFTFDFGQRAQQRFPGFTGLTSRADIRREFQLPLWANGLTGQLITDIVPQDLSEPLKKIEGRVSTADASVEAILHITSIANIVIYVRYRVDLGYLDKLLESYSVKTENSIVVK
ncbi:hypothetical protein HBI25_220840 [Parastagonospora nodorum]|nr:hypothetical protein HBI25_220840 [Parastagonospora nodorum]